MENIVLELLKEQGARLANIESQLSLSKNVLNLDEVCNLTGLSKSHIYKLTSWGKIPHYKQAKHLFFERTEVEGWLKLNRVSSNEDLESTANDSLLLTMKGGAR